MSPQCPYKPKRLYTNLKDPDDSRLSKSLACDSFNSIQGHAESTLRPRSKQVPLGFNPNPALEDTVRTLQVDRQASSLNGLAAFAEIYDIEN
ncbi:hypothetical protein SCA6_016739 [Theobroma cacao]